MQGFEAKPIDSFWLHLLVEAGAIGVLSYLSWLFLLCSQVVGSGHSNAGPASGGY